ncbi:MAG: hypothetical protein A2W00_10610 [Candidatus Eisenbacteria bacterium RBG_16_71_46]|nr:MAG: hypothetical protein A2W00_10610 [Candidatus Eisenbacteria bacterium RBG_16_71_46]OGF23713.1 MAG: hypothetical protein A2V63_13675 [Candidatus Eisenbacteria bacterium RBG_19FT_COMBO_70_11]
MAGTKRPSFLKRQKEQKRRAKAEEKREARRQRKHAKAEQGGAGDEFGSLEDFEVPDLDEETAGEEEDEESAG